MKAITKRTSLFKRHKVLIVLCCLIIAITVGAYFLVQYRSNQLKKQAAVEANKKNAETDKSSKKDILNKESDSIESTDGLPENSTSTTSDNVATNPNLSVTIVSTSQTGGNVAVTAQTNGAGSCVFNYEPADGGKPVSRQVNVSHNSCSVSISQNEFTYLGQWKLTATYYSGGKKAETSQYVKIY